MPINHTVGGVVNAVTVNHLRAHIAELRSKIESDIGRLERLPELSLSKQAEHLRRRINSRRIIIADLEQIIRDNG